MAKTAAKDLELEQMDVVLAYPHGRLDKNETIYVELPLGYLANGENCVALLNSALYGLKQGARVWYLTLYAALIKLGFKRNFSKHSLFVHSNGIIIGVFVDDLLIAGPSITNINELKKNLMSLFDKINLGPYRHYLGMEVIRDRKARTITLCQKSYLKNVLEKFGMANSHSVATSMTEHISKSPLEYLSDPELKKAYQAAVGSLIYAMTETRSDIAHAVSEVSQFAANPEASHLEVVKRIFRYINSTQDLSLVFRSDKTQQLVGYVDADWGRDLSTRRSTTGYAFYVFGCLVSWSTKKQPTVSLSSYKAEYIAATQATKELLFLRRLVKEIQLPPVETPPMTILHSDN